MTRRMLLAGSALGLLASCAKGPSAPKSDFKPRGVDDGTIKRYKLTGTVVRRDDESGVITIQHGPIANDEGKVWMDPMTMEFPVLDKIQIAQLTAGKKVRAVVAARESDLEYWLEEVRENEPPAQN